jgi:hypothetical protein
MEIKLFTNITANPSLIQATSRSVICTVPEHLFQGSLRPNKPRPRHDSRNRIGIGLPRWSSETLEYQTVAEILGLTELLLQKSFKASGVGHPLHEQLVTSVHASFNLEQSLDLATP